MKLYYRLLSILVAGNFALSPSFIKNAKAVDIISKPISNIEYEQKLKENNYTDSEIYQNIDYDRAIEMIDMFCDDLYWVEIDSKYIREQYSCDDFPQLIVKDNIEKVKQYLSTFFYVMNYNFLNDDARIKLENKINREDNESYQQLLLESLAFLNSYNNGIVNLKITDGLVIDNSTFVGMSDLCEDMTDYDILSYVEDLFALTAIEERSTDTQEFNELCDFLNGKSVTEDKYNINNLTEGTRLILNLTIRNNTTEFINIMISKETDEVKKEKLKEVLNSISNYNNKYSDNLTPINADNYGKSR